VQRWRLVVSRDAPLPDQPQRATLSALEDALRGSGLPVAGLDADPPKPRLAIAAPLPVGVPGEAELVDVWLVERLPRWRVREALGGCLPAGSRLLEVFDVWLGEAALPGQVVASLYRLELAPTPVGGDALRGAVAGILAMPTLPRTRRRGDKAVTYDLRPFVADVEVVEPAGREAAAKLVIRMELRHDPERGVGRPEEVLAELGDRLEAHLAAVSTTRERLILTSDRAGRPMSGAGPLPVRHEPPPR
jgi:radical SAM-linked protein